MRNKITYKTILKDKEIKNIYMAKYLMKTFLLFVMR